jgi:hypothetical protein
VRGRLTTESVVALNRLAGEIRDPADRPRSSAVVEKFGDRACDFLWRNKGTIFLAAVLARSCTIRSPTWTG